MPSIEHMSKWPPCGGGLSSSRLAWLAASLYIGLLGYRDWYRVIDTMVNFSKSHFGKHSSSKQWKIYFSTLCDLLVPWTMWSSRKSNIWWSSGQFISSLIVFHSELPLVFICCDFYVDSALVICHKLNWS